MMKATILLTALLLSLTANAQISVSRIKRQLETSAPKEHQIELRRGETVDFDLQFLSYGTVMDISGSTVTLHATTNGMPAGTSFQISGTAGSNGTASVRISVDEWLPYQLTSGTWTLECANPSASRIMRSSGVVKLSGLYYPSTNSPLPVTWATNLWTAISGIQSKTSDWNTAFGWGDHALLGYLTTNNPTYTATVDRASSAYAWGDHAAAGYLGTAGGELNENATWILHDLYLYTTYSVSGVALSSPPFGISATLNYPQDETGTVTFATREWTRNYVSTGAPPASASVPDVWTNMVWGSAETNATYRMSWDVTNGTLKVEEILP